MVTPIEIPITVISNRDNGFIEIMPAPDYGRLPASRVLRPAVIDPIYRLNWLNKPDSKVAQRNFQDKLITLGQSVISLLDNERLTDILTISVAENKGDETATWRRLLVYADARSSMIPLEAMWSNEHFNGNPIEFVSANRTLPVSIVRHLGQEASHSVIIPKNQPLKMLVVFSNPREANLRLGEVNNDSMYLDFTASLQHEKETLNAQLGDMVRLKLLEIVFLVGSESDGVVYQGRVEADKNGIRWYVQTRSEKGSLDLKKALLSHLDTGKYHVLHYFGHGLADSGLVLRPGDSLTHQELKFSVPRIVILHACNTAAASEPDAPVLTGFASSFLLHGTVNLICMQQKVTPETATLVTQKVYEKLSRSLFTRQMDFEEALYTVRQQVHKQDNPRLDFYCPVLYARPVISSIFAYQDNRHVVWNMIKDEQLPINPLNLYKVLRWYKELKPGMKQ